MRGLLAGIGALIAAFTIALPAAAAARPFELRDGQVVITVTLKGRELPALLDTGATVSLIEVGLAKELGIRVQKTSGGTFGAAGDGVAYLRSERAVEIDFGAGPMRRHVGAYPTGNVFAADGVRILLGMDFLGAMAVSLDFQSMTVDFERSSSFAAPSGQPLAMTNSGWRRPTLSVDISGVRAELLLDTAASGALHLDSSFVAGAPSLNKLPTSPTRIIAIDGIGDHDAIIVPHIAIGEHVFENVSASSASLGKLRAFGGMDGLVGVDLLRRFNLVVDFGRHRIWMTPISGPDD